VDSGGVAFSVGTVTRERDTELYWPYERDIEGVCGCLLRSDTTKPIKPDTPNHIETMCAWSWYKFVVCRGRECDSVCVCACVWKHEKDIEGVSPRNYTMYTGDTRWIYCVSPVLVRFGVCVRVCVRFWNYVSLGLLVWFSVSLSRCFSRGCVSCVVAAESVRLSCCCRRECFSLMML